MNQRVEIRIGQRVVGRIELEESDAALRRHGFFRLPNGFMLNLPAKLTLDWQVPGHWQPFVSGLRARVFVDDNSGVELGLAQDRNWYLPSNPRLEDHDLALELRGSLEALQILEKRRNGRAPKLWVQVSGEVCPTFKTNLGDGVAQVRGLPERIWGELHLSYPQETWAALLDNVGLIGNVLVEIPVRKDVPDGWKDIFGAVEESRRQLARGGDDGWKACVAATRLALERWRELEPEKLGQGWTAVKRDDREQWTKRERIDAVRWHLHQLAHLSPHSSAENWNRNDAILALAAVAGLLGARDP